MTESETMTESDSIAKILFIGATCSKNRGSAAMLISATNTLRQFIPESEFTVLSIFPKLDSKNCSAYNLNVLDWKGDLLKLSSYFFQLIMWKIVHIPRLINKGLLQEYARSDIIIDLSGDGFTDDYGIIESIASCYDILLCKCLNKPIVIYAQSIGPFKTKLTKSLSRFCLNMVDLLIVRDEITNNYLQDIGVTNTIHFTADSAFLLDASPYEIIHEIFSKENIWEDDRPIIGISTSQLIYDLELKKSKPNSENPYILLMAKIIDNLIDNLDAQIILVPHVTNDDRPVDDIFVAEKIFNVAINKDKIRSINNEYGPEELKGVIGKCDIFIGARMHANIAATSMCVPTLAIAYSHKSYGIMRTLGMEKYVLDFQTMTFDDIISKIDDLWINRVMIKMELEMIIPEIKEKAMLNGKMVKELLESLKSQ